MVNNAQPFLNNLKQQTASAHAALENLPLSLALTSPSLTTKNYIQYLRLMYEVVCNAEAAIFPLVCTVVTDCDERKKAHLIKNDLEFFNSELTTISFSFNTNQHNISKPFAMGIMYVLEGSTLGGRYIQKNVCNVLKVTEENGCSYFAGYKNHTGKLWLHFLNALSQFATDSNIQEEIISGAQFAFNEIYNLMKHSYKDED